MTSTEFDKLTIATRVWHFNALTGGVELCAICKLVDEPSLSHTPTPNTRGAEIITSIGARFVAPSAIFTAREDAVREGLRLFAAALDRAQTNLSRALRERDQKAQALEKFKKEHENG